LASDQDRADAALSAWQILTRKWRTIPEGIALIAKETTPLGFWHASLWSPALSTFPCSHEDFSAATNLFPL